MRLRILWQIMAILVLIKQSDQSKKNVKSAAVTDITDAQMFKKLLRTKINVLVLFINDPSASKSVVSVVKETADIMKGHATLVIIDCSNKDIRKLCKKQKISTEKPFYLKHYKDGDFHKEYDRSATVGSMTNFLRDPTGDLPWEEDIQAKDIFHLTDGDALAKFLKKKGAGYKKALVMFYAPWCSYCKIMKPEFVGAAASLKGEAALGAIDVSRGENAVVRQKYNITGFPTLLYFEKGALRYPYLGEQKTDAMVEFLTNPKEEHRKPVTVDSWSEDTDVEHLTSQNFDTVISKAHHALVVFYAPWCGHCKKIKPEFEKAASRVKAEKVNGVLAAVDATKFPDLSSRFDVKGFPTLKYFEKGEFKFDASHVRQEDQIVDFIKSPQEPPPPPPPEKPWSEEVSAVRHLDAETFRNALRKARHALVMFYAPWCGHCKSTKPEYTSAADHFANELMVVFGAVDCTAEQQVCATYGVKAYPTFKYFSFFDKLIKDYTGGRKEKDFVSYIHSMKAGHDTSQKAKTNQESGFGVNVVMSTDADFQTLIGETTNFVMFFASWCGHCVAAKPTFSKLATTLKDGNIPVRAVAIDAAENPKTADFASIDQLPTFKIYAQGKFLADYTGDRSFDDLLKFCKSHVKVKDEF